MDAYTIRDAAERLDDLVERVEAGEHVNLKRDGRVVARLVAAPAETVRDVFDWEAYFEKIKDMPMYPGCFVEDMRKDNRY
ncbi:MAG TPA: hypothetical protein VF695_10320 [Sphingomonas sp.]|jgi:antitoxin (DNA-binding transcriptional repressor) of toxin-antitoxin stability system